MIDADGRQVAYLLFGDVELDTVEDVSHGADRNGDFLAAEHAPLLEEHVGHVVTARVDDQPLNSPDGVITRMEEISRAWSARRGCDGSGVGP